MDSSFLSVKPAPTINMCQVPSAVKSRRGKLALTKKLHAFLSERDVSKPAKCNTISFDCKQSQMKE